MKGEGGVNWEGGTDIYTQPCAKQLLETAIEHRELSLVRCDDPEWQDRGWEGGSGGRESMCARG